MLYFRGRLVFIFISTNATHDSGWAESNGLADNIPKTYLNISAVVYPCYIKFTQGSGGDGIELCHNRTSLDGAISRQKGRPYILQQAIRSNYEIAINTISLRGRLLGTITVLCSPGKELDVITPINYPKCVIQSMAQIDRIVPLSALLKDIMRSSGYSGIAATQVKISAGYKWVDKYLSALAPYANDFDAHSVEREWREITSIQPSESLKIIEINPRSASLMKMPYHNQLKAMLVLYLTELLGVESE